MTLQEQNLQFKRKWHQHLGSADAHKVLQDRLAYLRASNYSDEGFSPQALRYTLDWILTSSQPIDADLLIEFISELIRFMENAGEGLLFRQAIDQTIVYYEKENNPMVDLYLAKVEYLRLTDTESPEKIGALKSASRAVRSPTEHAKVQLKLIQYYIDSSQYQEALAACKDLEDYTSKHSDVSANTPKLYDLFGITHYYLFETEKADQYFKESIRLGKEVNDLHTVGEAMHYRGRIKGDQGMALEAMRLFIEARQYQPDNLADAAWYHLRMGDLLVNADLIDEAVDHYNQAQTIFREIKYTGSANTQIELSWGRVYRAMGRYSDAERHYKKAMELSLNTEFPRGALLIIVHLFWLQLAYLHRPHSALATFSRGMVNKEVWRNTGPRLIMRYALQVILIPINRMRGASYSVPGVSASYSTPLLECLCPLHKNNITKDTQRSQ